MKQDEYVVVFLNHKEAKRMTELEPSIAPILVITDVIPDGQALVIPEEEFAEFLLKERDSL